jgi:hypothetical protein
VEIAGAGALCIMYLPATHVHTQTKSKIHPPEARVP